MVIGAVVAAVALTVTPAQAAKRGPGCHPRGAKTAARTAKVRVFWVRKRLYACRSGNDRAFFIGELDDPCPASSSVGCDAVEDIRIAGRYVAVVWYVEQRDRSAGSVHVVDMAQRKRVRTWSTPNAVDRFGEITDIELTSRGSLALIVASYRTVPLATSTYEVRTLGTDREALLDEGPDIDPWSLARARNGALYWTNGGSARSATLR
jgi:hypothetical protein